MAQHGDACALFRFRTAGDGFVRACGCLVPVTLGVLGLCSSSCEVFAQLRQINLRLLLGSLGRSANVEQLGRELVFGLLKLGGPFALLVEGDLQGFGEF